jgi:cell division protein FtsB
VFCGVLLLYIHPLLSMWSTRGEAQKRRAEVVRLQAEQRALARREKALRDPHELELAARRLGMVRTGEKAYVVSGLPGGPR